MPSPSDPFDDPELARLGAELREQLLAERRDDERLAALDHLRRRQLPDVALELLHRGDLIAVELATRTLTGVVGYTASDLLCLRCTPAANADVRLGAPLVLRVLQPAPDGGLGRAVGPSGFKARLFEHEASRTPVTILTHSGELLGRIHAVADDHLVVEEHAGQRCYVAWSAVTAVLA